MCFIKTSEPLKSATMKAFYRSISNTSSTCDSEYYYGSDSELGGVDFADLDKDFDTNSMDAGTALRAALTTAQAQGRLTCGIYEAAQLLELTPEGVMLCVVPVDTATDVAMHIHLTLIEAFCWENDIRIIKVDSSDMLQEAISGKAGEEQPHNDNDVSSGRVCRKTPDDFSCILVEYPSSTGEMSEAEEDVLQYHKQTCHLAPQPVLALAASIPAATAP